MIKFYWPGKKVSEKVVRISFKDCIFGDPSYCHGGFGLIVKRKNIFFVFGFSGSFIKGNAAGGAVTAVGQAGGIRYHEKFSKFIEGLSHDQ